MKRLVTIILFFVCFTIGAQENSFETLDEVHIYSHFSPTYRVGNSLVSLSDSLLKSNSSNLTSFLKKYTNIYMKEQGEGMVSSISMRGSGASHTAVFWNGVPINSSLNGQTDFNTLYTSSFNAISIKKGGGSVFLGSGAIGGALNLENKLYFKNKTSAIVQASVGSYNSFSSNIQVNHSTNKTAIEIGVNGNTSKNNYSYYNTDLRNKNGELKHYSVLLNAGIKLNQENSLYIKSALNNSDRNTSGTLTTTNNANMDFDNQSFLLGWLKSSSRFESEFKTAYLKENYIYTFNKENPDFFSENVGEKYFSNYSFNYFLNQDMQLSLGASYEYLTGKGTDIQDSNRQKLAFFGSFHHVLSQKFKYNISVREDLSSAYKIPFVYSLDSKYHWHKNHSASFNISTNFRTPSLNDLFWQPGGNPNLKPEENLSSELGYEWANPFFNLGINLFSSRSKNLIQWRRITDSFWQPVNIQKLNAQGFEFSIASSKEFNQHKIDTSLSYSFTESRDKDTQMQLIYVPKQLGNLLLSYSYKNWFFELNENYIGKVFITSSNTQSLDDYLLSNFRIQHEFLNKKLIFALAVNNLFNTDYEIVSSRPMPNRNLNLLITYKL